MMAIFIRVSVVKCLLLFSTVAANKVFENFEANTCKHGEHDLHLHGLSYTACLDECKARELCTGNSYNRFLKLCIIHGTDAKDKPQSDCMKFVYSEKSSWTEKSISCDKPRHDRDRSRCVGSEDCANKDCPEPTTDTHGIRHGNMRTVGAKVAFTCDRYSVLKGVNRLTCLPGEDKPDWSDQFPSCVVAPTNTPTVPSTSQHTATSTEDPQVTETTNTQTVPSTSQHATTSTEDTKTTTTNTLTVPSTSQHTTSSTGDPQTTETTNTPTLPSSQHTTSSTGDPQTTEKTNTPTLPSTSQHTTTSTGDPQTTETTNTPTLPSTSQYTTTTTEVPAETFDDTLGNTHLQTLTDEQKIGCHGQSCYFVDLNERTFAAAVTYCNSTGSHVVVPSTQGEYEQLLKMITESGKHIYTFWIGIEYINNDWVSITGEDIFNGLPQNTTVADSVRCMILQPGNRVVNFSCLVGLRTICEYPRAKGE